MNSSVIVFPGSNCDRDIAVALEKMQFKNKMVWHKETKLPKSDLIVVPGGFSYGDYLRSGAIAGKSLIPLNEVRSKAKSFAWEVVDIPEPPFVGHAIVEEIALDELIDFIDWTFFFTSWDIPRRYPGVLEDEKYGEEFLAEIFLRQFFQD